MSKSFFYSLLIHLFLGVVFLAVLLQPTPKHEEQKISIKLRSSSQPIQPSCACQPEKTPPPSEPITTPIATKQPITTIQKQPIPVQTTKPTVPAIETPAPKPSAPVATQPVVPPIVKTSSLPPEPPPPPPVNVEKEYIKLNLAEIRAILIQHQQYPKQAKRLRMQGDVELHFQLNANGSVEDLKIVQSSGFEILDEDARALILKTAPLFPKPSKSVQLKLPISYILR